MTLRIADFLAVRTTDDNGTDIPRYTNFRAVIPLDKARKYASNGGQVTVRIEADDAHIDGDDTTSYLFEAVLPGVHVDDSGTDIRAAAVKVLTVEGFEVAGLGWQRANTGFETWIEAAGANISQVQRIAERIAASGYLKVAEHTLGVPAALVDAAIAQGLVRLVRVQETLAKPGGERMLAAVA